MAEGARLGKNDRKASRMIRNAGSTFFSALKILVRANRGALLTVLIISFGMLGLEELGWLRPVQTAALDLLFRGKPQNASDDIMIVEITDEDYKKIFGATSPLEACRVIQLITGILDAQPAVIGVDLETADSGCKDAETMRRLDAKLKEDPYRVIWAQVPELSREGDEEGGMVLQRVLGGYIRGESGKDKMGIPMFALDPDGVVRQYQGEFEHVTGGGLFPPPEDGRMDSLARAVLKNSHRPVSGEAGEVMFNFTGDRYSFPIVHARDFLSENGEDLPRAGLKQALRGRIVLLGGAYRAARDEYITPLGAMAGVELVAHAIESDLHGGGIREMQKWKALLYDLLAGVLLVLLPRKRFWVSGASFVVPFLGSLLTFHSLAYWLDFVPIVLGITVHRVHDFYESYHELRHDLAKAEGRIKSLEGQLAQATDLEETEP
jgi:CHASE2 domain-containing sensor protein